MPCLEVGYQRETYAMPTENEPPAMPTASVGAQNHPFDEFLGHRVADRFFNLDRLADLPFAYSSIACLTAGASAGMAFMEASASASGGRANGVLTGAGAQGSVGFGRGTRARMCFGRDMA